MRALLVSLSTLLVCAPSAWALDLQAPNGTTFRIAETGPGDLQAPASFVNWPRLCVRVCDACEAPCAAGDVYDAAGAAAQMELNGLQAAMATQPLAGLQVRRKVFVPSAGGVDANGFVRFLDLLTNPTGAPITVNVRLGSVTAGGGTLGAGHTIWRTADDDAELEVGDRWWMTDDDQPEAGLGSVAAVVHGAGARVRPARMAMAYPDAGQPTALAWDYDQVQIAPDQTVAFLTVVNHETARVRSIDEAQALIQVRDVDVLFGMTDAERRAVLNFDVENGAGAPVADAGGPYNAEEGRQVQLAASGYDPELGPLQYAWDLDEDDVFDDAQGSNAVALFPDDGVREVCVRVTDQAGETDVDCARVTVINVAPTIDGVNSNAPIDEGSNLEVTVLVNEPGDDVLTFDFDWDGDGDYEAIDEQPVQPPARFSHRYAADGVFQARVRVRDDEGAQSTQVFEVQVDNVAPQVLQIVAPSPAREGQVIGVQVIAFDPGNDPIIYEYDTDGDGQYDVDGVGLSQIEVSYPDNQLVRLRVRVTDDRGASSDRQQDISILNERPTIDLITNNGPVLEGEEVVIDVAASDPGAADTLTYSFDFDNDGSFEDDIVDQEDRFAGTVFHQQGMHTVGVRVRDDDGGFAVDASVVEVLNADPVAEIFAPEFADEGQTFEVSVVASDPGDDRLVYDWDLTGDGLYDLVGVPDAVQETSFADDGDHVIRCRVSDGDGGEVVVEATVRVRNVRPVLEIEFDSPQGEGAEVAVRALVEDPGNDELHYFYDFDDDGDFEIDGLDPVGRWRYPDEGVYRIRVLVDDGANVIDGTGDITIENVAPSIDLQVNSPVDEGSTVRYDIAVADPGEADTVTVDLYRGVPCPDGGRPVDMEPELSALEPDEDGDLLVEQTALDGRESTRICACAEDNDGGVRCTDVELQIRNVPPTIPEFMPPLALEGQPYRGSIPATDPANPEVGEPRDPLVFSLVDPPAGIAVDAAFGSFQWVPTYEHYLSSPIALRACVEDGDGGEACRDFAVTVRCADDDVDEMCDTWERNTCNGQGQCLDPADPNDGAADPDRDGRPNSQEFAEGTDPFTYEGPGQPAAVGPAEGTCSDTVEPVLEVTRAESDLELPVQILFEVYSDADLMNPVIDSGWMAQPDAGNNTWTVTPGTLFEDQWYWWRARARSGEEGDLELDCPDGSSCVNTEWTLALSLRTNGTNEAPTAPVSRAPEDGSTVDTVRPTLEVLPSTDPDAPCDTVLYRFRLYQGDSAYTTGEGTLEGDVVRFTPGEDLIEDGTFTWDVVAVDGSAETSAPSERWTFTINTGNRAPDTPTILYPEHRSTVESLTPEFRAGGSVDLDDPELYYHFTVREKLGADVSETITIESGDVLADGNLEASWVPEEPLTENVRYVVEVYATDGEANSEVVSAEFFASAVDEPPAVPELLKPDDGAIVPKAGLVLTWGPAEDPEGAEVNFEVEICKDAGCETREAVTRGLPQATEVFEGKSYKWRVRALDSGGVASDWSEQRSFTVEAPTSAGSEPSGCDCDVGGSSPPGLALLLMLLGIRRRRR